MQRIENRRPIGLRVRYLMALDCGCILLAVAFAFVIRYEALLNIGPYLRHNWSLVLLAPLVRLPIYYALQLYRRLWRYASTHEFKVILWAGVLGFIGIYGVNFGILPALNLPYCPSRSVVVLEACLSLAFLGGTRFLLRLWQERISPSDVARIKALVQSPSRVLIFGAGDAGALMLREMQGRGNLGIHVVGFIDDNPEKTHLHIHGVSVLGKRRDIPTLVKKHHIDEMIIAMPTAPGKEIREIKAICEEAKVRYKILPSLYELLNGTATINQIREVQIEDLLRREPISPNPEGARYLADRVVLVTGAGGSIGSELSRQVAAQCPSKLILLDQAETALYQIDLELRRRYPDLILVPVVADIRDQGRIERVMITHHPEVVFHAAAYKHVPLMELNREEVVLNNILGTRNLVQAAERQGVQNFVLISTDKAVDPANFMGASKRVTELLVQDAAVRSGRSFVAVRFGNVLGSQGSVVPLFKQQIAAGGPVTVTHPDMERYFMTIPEAVQLVIQAGNLGKGGEIFVLDMGNPVKIMDLAIDMITLSGLQPGRDVEIVFTGLRPGEKLEEQLFNSQEAYTRTGHEKIFVVTEEMPLESKKLHWGTQKLIRAAQDGQTEQLWKLITELVPECAGQPAPASEPPVVNFVHEEPHLMAMRGA